jgi:adenylate cyclase
MPKLFRIQRDLDPFEEELRQQALISEKLRALLLLVFIGAFGLLVIVGLTAFRTSLEFLRPLVGDLSFFERLLVLIGLAFLYELLVFRLLGIVVLRRIQVPALPRFGNALIETSLPSLAIWLLATTAGPGVALNAPPFLLYFIFIILSTLRLSLPLSLFTGLVAGIEYLVLSLALLHGNDSSAFIDSWLPSLPKALSLAVSGALAGFVARRIKGQVQGFLRVAEERNRVIGIFGQHVSPQVVDRLLGRTEAVESEIRNVAILFLDIRGFTKFSENRSPSEIVAYLNILFDRQIEVVNANGGIINKFLGDGFMAVFGAPLSDGHECRNALKAALALADVTDAMVAQGLIPATRIGIGIHAGDAVTGTVGSARRREYTIIGDTVNLASRVEALNKEFSSTILATDAAYLPVADEFEAEALPAQKIRGREHEVAIYRLR